MGERHSGISNPSEGDEAHTSLRELCRVHDVSVELIELSDDPEALLERILAEYEDRLQEVPADSLRAEGERVRVADDDTKLRGLLLFAAQAVALKVRAEAAEGIRRHADELRLANERLTEALAEAERSRNRLTAVTEAMDAGVLIVGVDGNVEEANPAASRMLGKPESALRGRSVSEWLNGVPAGGRGEVVWTGADDVVRTWLASRADLGAGGGEVVLLQDVTERDRELHEDHESRMMAEVLRTVAVLAHKINNPLTALMGRTQLLRLGTGQSEEMVKGLAVIEQASQRISALIRHLAELAKEGKIEGLENVLDIRNESHPGGGKDR